jgi:RNA polymerase sigma-70 factor (ECF subfamily)
MAKEEVVRLFMKHQRMLREFILTLIPDPNDADDILQEVSVIVLAKSEPPRDLQKFPEWCRGVARNVMLHHWRRQKKTMTPPSARFMESVEIAYQEGDAREDEMILRRKALEECLKRLPESSRTLLELRYVRQAPSQEIARTQGSSPAGVRMTLLRIRQALNSCIQGRLAGEIR